MTEIERGGCAEFERGGRDNEWSSKQLCSFPPVHPVPPNGGPPKCGLVAEGEGEVVKSPSAHPSDLRRQWAEKQLWATHSPLLQPCPMGPRHTYTNTVRHSHRMWTCRCTPNTCTLQRFLFPQTHLHTLRLYNKKEIYKLWITFTNSSLENISRDVIGRRGTVNGKPKEMFKFYVSFWIFSMTNQSVGF